MIVEALELFGLADAEAELIRHNENMTYQVIHPTGKYLLRIHKPLDGYNLELLRGDIPRRDLVIAEMRILSFLQSNPDLHTQKPLLASDNSPVAFLPDGTPVTVFEWVEGSTLEDIKITPEIAYNIGVMIGKIHQTTSELPYCDRYRYDQQLLERMIAVTHNEAFQQLITPEIDAVIVQVLHLIRDYLSKQNTRMIITHADLSKSNMILHDNIVTPIDFSLAGYCIPEMDLAAAILHLNQKTLGAQVIQGYTASSQHEVDEYGIKLCLCFQILLFITCQYTQHATEPWFQQNLQQWSKAYFEPLLATNAPAPRTASHPAD